MVRYLQKAYEWAALILLRRNLTAIKLGLLLANKKILSIPIMITNQMRMDLSICLYEIHLTPKECWKIINRGVP